MNLLCGMYVYSLSDYLIYCIFIPFICCPFSQHIPNYKWILMAFKVSLWDSSPIVKCLEDLVLSLLFVFFLFPEVKLISLFFEYGSSILNMVVTDNQKIVSRLIESCWVPCFKSIELYIFYSLCCPWLRHFGEYRTLHLLLLLKNCGV